MTQAQFIFGTPFLFWNVGFFRTSIWVLALYGLYRLWRYYGNRRTQSK